jgi:hypothetical protein
MANELRSATFTISVNGQEKGTTIVAMVKSVEQLEAIERELNATSAINTTVTKSQITTQKEANAVARLAIREYQSQQKAIANVVTDLNNQNKMLTMSTEKQQVFNAQLRAGVDPLSAEGRQIAYLVTQHQKLVTASGGTQSSFRNLRGQAQNLGWQMQDVAVQAQMGTDALVILSQQGSQVASGFGPAGAVVGALIAVGGAIAGVVFNTKGLKEAQELAKVTTAGLTDKLYEQAKAGKLLTTNQKAYLASIQQEKIINYKTELNKLSKELKENETKVEDLKTAMANAKATTDSYMKSLLPGTMGVLGKKLEDLTKTITAQKGIFDEVTEEAKQAQKDLDSIEAGTKFETDDDLADKLKQEADAVRDATKAWVDKIATISMTEREAALYALTADATNAAERAAIPTQAKLINSYYDKKEAIDEATKALKRQAAADKASAKELMANIAAENKAIAKRASRLDKIETAQIKESQINDPVGAEMALFEQNIENLNQMKREAGEYSITEQIRINGLLESEEERHASAMQRSYLTQAESYSSMGAMMASSMSAVTDILSTGGEDIMSQMDEMTAMQRLMFIATQAFVAADSVLSGYQQANNWLKSPLAVTAPFVAEGLAQASIAMGYTNAGVVMGTTFAGAFDKGGIIPSGQAGIVSEFGDELVGGTMVYNNSSSGLNVTGREDTAALMNGGGSSQTIINQYLTVSGTGDKALSEALAKTAKESVQTAYNAVANDFKNDRGMSKLVSRRK